MRSGEGLPGWVVPVVGGVMSLLLAGNLFFAQRFMEDIKSEITSMRSQVSGIVDLRIDVMVLKNKVADLSTSIEKRRN